MYIYVVYVCGDGGGSTAPRILKLTAVYMPSTTNTNTNPSFPDGRVAETVMDRRYDGMEWGCKGAV